MVIWWTVITFTWFMAIFHGQQGWIIFFPHRESLLCIQKQLINFYSADRTAVSQKGLKYAETILNDTKEIMSPFITEINKILAWLTEWLLLCHRHQVNLEYASTVSVMTWTKILRDKSQWTRKTTSVWNMSEAECFLYPVKMTFSAITARISIFKCCFLFWPL